MLGNVLHDAGNFDEALIELRAAEAVFRELKADAHLAEVLRLIASCSLGRGDLNTGRDAALESQSLAASSGVDAIAKASAQLERRAEAISQEVGGTTVDSDAPRSPLRVDGKETG